MGELPQQGLFNVIAEVAATFVGFSMIVGLFRRDAGGRARVFATRDVAEVSL
ncbi:MAG: hypothetical protein GWO40_04620, partial [Gammaproteobacteria bacterium]|nr:hypothetical protein [Gammaproteobacteria bacterium]NIX84844.1 hypothetical protein [Gammaproteobacteria bacterium]